ncbi:tetratricopeptide repeat protein [Nocardia grenadensis]|uniref:tetratricopeptide repeat protein n=1 Tax=Nocardia grenadensis TaxID=931537 RepID=UPI001471B64D|nr:tetratricopeptide repeat protein [Nocardia grenadensis]
MVRVEEAIGLYEEVFAIRRLVLGEDDPATVTTERGLVRAEEAARKLDEAFALLNEVLAPLEKVLGQDHVKVKDFRGFLSSFQKRSNS